MEQLVLGIFQEQLAKVIIGFRKEQVNANLLNGKGEIRDVSLNCSLFNEYVARVCPYIRIEEIHVSRLGFHVTSWTNIRKAPIIVDIGHITAKIEEPLIILPPEQRRRIQIITERELNRKLAQGFKPLRGTGSYGLVDRIVDNLTIEIESVRLEFQTWGKFKTRRPGPWTPPLLRAIYKNLKICSVDAEGSEGNPDQVWAHNQGRRDTFLTFKKVTGECKIQIVPQWIGSNQKEDELSTMNLEVQIATERRLQDGAFLACQLDVTIPEIDVDIDTQDIRLLAHLSSGIHYCLAKDRSFDDPLKSLSESDNARPSSSCSPSVVDLATVEKGPNRIFDVGSRQSSFDANSVQDDGSASSLPTEDGISQDEDPSVANDSTHDSVPATATSRDRSKRERSVILLPNDLVIYRSVSLTCSINKLVVWASYSEDDEEGCLEFAVKGCVAEAIWPKLDGEHGLYLQLSTAFVSLEERVGHHQRVLLLAGMQRGDHLSMSLPSRKPQEIGRDEFFPLFERRSIRDDPLDLRHLFPTQAFGLKTTIDVLHEAKDYQTNNPLMIMHEIGGDEIELVLDAGVFLRVAKFIMNTDGEGLDPRWDTGDWSDLLTPEILRSPSDMLYLDEYLQESSQLFLDENLMISSDLLNVTARLSNVVIRIPAAVEDSLRSCDIILKCQEVTFVVSSDLPQTFLTGKVGNSITGEEQDDSQKGVIDFPNDPSDVCYRYEQGFTGKERSTFRFQLTPRGFEVNMVPTIPFCTAPDSQRVISICDATMIFSFEGEPPEDGCHRINITVFFSILVQELIMNIDLDILAGATCTLLSHKKQLVAIMQLMNSVFSNSQDAESTSSDTNLSPKKYGGRLEQSLKGRRILTSRQVSQSRETGGFAFIFCFQQKDFRLRVWRQNVPIKSPLRDNLQSSQSFKYQGDGGLIELLNLFDVEMQDLEIGIEFDYRSNSGHRTVVKSYLKHAHLKIVDLEKEIEECRSLPTGTPIRTMRYLTDLCIFGKESMPCGLSPSGLAQHFAFRLEAHHKNNSQSWSMAVDVSAPSTISLDVESVRTGIILIIEALLLPAWSNGLIETKDAFLFPPGTIGAMFYSIVQELFRKQVSTLEHIQSPKIEENCNDPMLERFFRSVCKAFLPQNLQVILLRCAIANMLISIPAGKIEEKKKRKRDTSIFLEQSDIVARFYPIPVSSVSDIEQVLACKGTDWSTLINTNKEGLYFRFNSRQSVLSIIEENEARKFETAVRPFDIHLKYSDAGVDFSMGQGISIDDIRLIENILSILKSVVAVSSEYVSEVCHVVRALVNRGLHVHKDEGKRLIRECSVSKARNLIREANKEFHLQENSIRDSIRKRDNELEMLKVDLFRKEMERFGALSLMSSRVAGWIRMGSQHRSGQRVVKKSLLWPFWAVLRKELLILSPRPGEPKPSDIVSLKNARLRNLAGGSSKQDTKRGFAIIESSGMVRYFVTANAQEYELWTNEIDFAIRLFADGSNLLNSEDSSDTRTSELASDGMNDEKASQKTSMIGNRLSSAFQSARFKGRQSSQTLDESIREEEPSDVSNGIEKGFEMNEAGQAQEPPTSKRTEISKKFSEVGIMTRSRLGSALQNARNKREEISNTHIEDSAERISHQEESVVYTDDKSRSTNSVVVDEDADGTQGSFGARTGLQIGNKLGSAFQTARMKAKGSIEKQGLFRGNEQRGDHQQNDGRKIPDPMHDSSLPGSASTALETSRTGNDSLQLSIRSNDVARQEENNRRSSRFNFLKRTEEIQNDALFGGDLITLKNIYAEHDNIRSLPHESRVEVELKTLKKRWFVKVSEIVQTTDPSSESTMIMDDFDEKKTTTISLSSELKDDASGPPLSLDIDHDMPHFLVKVSQAQRTQTTALVEKQWSLGDAFRFYSVISEAIADTLTHQHGKLSSIWVESSSPSSGQFCTTSFFENVMVCGRVLGGLFEAGKSFDCIEGFRRYQCESIENFLNSLLECPLPIDGLMILCGTLGIDEPMEDFQLITGDSPGAREGVSPTASVVGDTTYSNELKEEILRRLESKSSTVSDDHAGRIFNLLTACEAELQHIESKKESMEETSRGENASTTQVQPVFYEPLLPPTLTERIHHSVRKALTNLMAQRDEAHAQLIGANVMHSNSLERMRRKNERLEIDSTLSHDIARAQLKQDLDIPNFANLFGGPDERLKKIKAEIDQKIEKVHNAIMNDDGDAEMMQLCSQLASEISTKTSLVLQIERMKETREIERETQDFEKEALQDEMRSLRDLLEIERQKSAKACAEAAHWKALYEECQGGSDGGAL